MHIRADQAQPLSQLLHVRLDGPASGGACPAVVQCSECRSCEICRAAQAAMSVGGGGGGVMQERPGGCCCLGLTRRSATKLVLTPQLGHTCDGSQWPPNNQVRAQRSCGMRQGIALKRGAKGQ